MCLEVVLFLRRFTRKMCTALHELNHDAPFAAESICAVGFLECAHAGASDGSATCV